MGTIKNVTGSIRGINDTKVDFYKADFSGVAKVPCLTSEVTNFSRAFGPPGGNANIMTTVNPLTSSLDSFCKEAIGLVAVIYVNDNVEWIGVVNSIPVTVSGGGGEGMALTTSICCDELWHVADDIQVIAMGGALSIGDIIDILNGKDFTFTAADGRKIKYRGKPYVPHSAIVAEDGTVNGYRLRLEIDKQSYKNVDWVRKREYSNMRVGEMAGELCLDAQILGAIIIPSDPREGYSFGKIYGRTKDEAKRSIRVGYYCGDGIPAAKSMVGDISYSGVYTRVVAYGGQYIKTVYERIVPAWDRSLDNEFIANLGEIYNTDTGEYSPYHDHRYAAVGRVFYVHNNAFHGIEEILPYSPIPRHASASNSSSAGEQDYGARVWQYEGTPSSVGDDDTKWTSTTDFVMMRKWEWESLDNSVKQYEDALVDVNSMWAKNYSLVMFPTPKIWWDHDTYNIGQLGPGAVKMKTDTSGAMEMVLEASGRVRELRMEEAKPEAYPRTRSLWINRPDWVVFKNEVSSKTASVFGFNQLVRPGDPIADGKTRKADSLSNHQYDNTEDVIAALNEASAAVSYPTTNITFSFPGMHTYWYPGDIIGTVYGKGESTILTSSDVVVKNVSFSPGEHETIVSSSTDKMMHTTSIGRDTKSTFLRRPR